MHCYNPDFKNIAILPPYNTLWAQVIKVGNPPQIVTTGIIVEYSFPDNTYSAGSPTYPDKTNFWDYSQKLFGVTLAKDIGLTGKGLSGQMTAASDHFIAEGIPITEFTDTTAKSGDPSTWTAYPWQQALIVVKDAATGVELASTPTTAPVSTEINCGNCHGDDGDATTKYPITPTGNVDMNILALHDYLNAAAFTSKGYQPLMDNRPVLCASCHSSNALGAAGVTGVKSLSNAVHGHHIIVSDITPDTNGCYNCHPGPITQCLRDVMSQEEGMTCIDCHGTLSNVAKNTNPWLNEPRCDSCHEDSTQTQALYRFSVGHSGVYCEGCHDSTHAIAQSREQIDGLKFVLLQGEAETLKECTVCHTTKPSKDFTHTYVTK
jgi:mono/diheme cytochrome c family protein